jgi:hypothetical protein
VRPVVSNATNTKQELAMNFMIARAFVAALLLSAAPGVAGAASDKYLSSTDLQSFDAQSSKLVVEMAKGGRFQSITAEEQGRVNELLGLIRGVLIKSPDVKSLRDSDKVLVFNSQEEINAILTGNDGDRLICSFEEPTGSHRKKKICVTKAEKDRQQEMARRVLESRPGSTTGGSGN